MNDKKTARNKLVQARLTEKELDTIHEKYSRSTCQKLSDFVRKKLMDKPITTYFRNQSLDDFMAEMITLRKELNAIGINYNQVVKRLYQMDTLYELKQWLEHHETNREILFKKMEDIKSKINQINEQWLRS